MNGDIVILGGGLAGLSTAYHLGNGCRLYEQDGEVGGLARSDTVNGFTFDRDGHLLHFKTKYAKKLIERLLPDDLTAHKRSAWVFSHDVYTPYPFQANTFGLPQTVVKDCIFGMVTANTGSCADGESNLRDWMVNNFGAGITRHFLYPYNKKFWTLPPEKLISDWTSNYVPRVGVKDVINGAFFGHTALLGYNATFWYPRRGGIDRLAKALRKKLKDVKINHCAKAIDIEKRKVLFVNGETADFSVLVSTIPLVELKDLIIQKMPLAVKQAFSRLKYISVYNLNLGVEREGVSDKHWIYFPEEKFCFFRVGFPTNFSGTVAPKSKSSLYVELSYSEYRPLRDKQNIEKRIHADLIKAGILRKTDKIVARHINDIKYAYVIYDHNYRESIEIISDFLFENNIIAAGRFGRWNYMSMEDVILEGKAVSEQVKHL